MNRITISFVAVVAVIAGRSPLTVREILDEQITWKLVWSDGAEVANPAGRG